VPSRSGVPQTDYHSSDLDSELIQRCLVALRGRGIPVTYAEIARLTGIPESTVSKVIRGERGLGPEFLCQLGEVAGVPVLELFMDRGWLPRDEVLRALAGPQDLSTALRDIDRLRPHLDRFAEPSLPTPVRAANALLSDPEGAERFEIRLEQVVCGSSYRTPTITLAEFSLKQGIAPFSLDRMERLAGEAGIHLPESAEEVAADPAFWSIRLELMTRTRRALSDGQEATWQGGPRHRTWLSLTQGRPAHLLVQDAIGGRQRKAGVAPWELGEESASLIVVGGRHGTGLAAPLLAEALGWQYVLIRGDVEVAPDGRVVAMHREPSAGRVRAWISAAERVEESAEAGKPWQAVILVRPAAFDTRGLSPHLERRALDLIRRTPGRVIYARTPDAYLSWWGQRIEGDHFPGGYDADEWVSRTRTIYDRLESVLAQRTAPHDLLLRPRDPEDGLEPHDPAVPAEVIDSSVRVAWTALDWVTAGKATRSGRPRAGLLAQWADALRADHQVPVPGLVDLHFGHGGS
jgi:transcriptional regulator with XRE-family HTH domain